ncbi:MAG: TatD family hydrolase [bacterium]|nr:TatD family hydrolase [bacterium]
MFPLLLDTHTHLMDPQYADDRRAIIQRAMAAKVWLIVVGTDYESSREAIAVAEQYSEGVYAAVGAHPLSLHGTADADGAARKKLIDFEGFRELLRHPKVVAIGEVGLDFHDLHLPGVDSAQAAHRTALQYEALGQFLELSQEFRLPLLLHVREAHDEMIRYLSEFDRASRGFDSRGIIHHFTGSGEHAAKYIHLDFLLSVTPLLARSQTQELVFQKAPLSKIVLESECPYLTDPTTGSSRTEPAHLVTLAANMAAIRGISADEFAKETTRNALRLCSKILRTMPATEKEG